MPIYMYSLSLSFSLSCSFLLILSSYVHNYLLSFTHIHIYTHAHQVLWLVPATQGSPSPRRLLVQGIVWLFTNRCRFDEVKNRVRLL